VLLALSEQPLRYNRLLERLPGVSRRMLTDTLRRLAPHSGSAEPAGSPREHEPSDSPGTFTHSFASSSGEPVARVVGRSPRPRPGGLHRDSWTR
jgi:HxlR-like helix-turn-helix